MAESVLRRAKQVAVRRGTSWPHTCSEVGGGVDRGAASATGTASAGADTHVNTSAAAPEGGRNRRARSRIYSSCFGIKELWTRDGSADEISDSERSPPSVDRQNPFVNRRTGDSASTR